MKRTIAALTTLGLILAAIVWGRRQSTTTEAIVAVATPEHCIERMFDVAERGDVVAYLDCFTGPERLRLDRELSGQSLDAFASSLVQVVSELKGRAVYEASKGTGDDDQALLIVERVYASRTEKQLYALVHEPDAWRIHSVQNAEPHQPDKAYGTPVFEMAK